MAKIVVNAPGSPVQITVRKGVSKAGREYQVLDLVIGDFETRGEQKSIFLSPLQAKEVNRVISTGADALLEDE